jgi:hypothetical protein
MIKYLINNVVLTFNKMNELVSGVPAAQFETNLRECEDQNWLKVQAVPVFRFELCKMISRTPGGGGVRALQVKDHWFKSNSDAVVLLL